MAPYNAKICKRAVQLPIDLSQFSLSIWNNLEACYTANKIYSLVQADLRLQQNPKPHNLPHNIFWNHSSWAQQHHPQQSDLSRFGRCIFCGDHLKLHTSCNCTATSNINSMPCHLLRLGTTCARQGKLGKTYCLAWNGFSSCDHGPFCQWGEHWCTLCGTISHNAQACSVIFWAVSCEYTIYCWWVALYAHQYPLVQ